MLKKVYFNILKAYFKMGSRIAPKFIGDQSFRLFQKVQVRRIRDREIPFYDNFDLEIIEHDKHPIHVYHSKKKNFEQKVFLVHGWDSNPGSMLELAMEIEKAGFGILALNIPAHGKAKGTHTNIIECVEVFNRVLDLQEKPPTYLVSHSFGSAVSSYALAKSDHEMERMVFLSTPDTINEVFEAFQDIIPISDLSLQRMMERAEELSGEKMDQLSVFHKLKRVNFKHLSFIHDRNDVVLPYDNSKRIHESLPNSSLLPFEDIGHYKMLWNKEVISTTISELSKEL